MAQGSGKQGFASMDEAKQKEIASKGGKASGGNFKNDPQRASEAGKKGGSRQPAQESYRIAWWIKGRAALRQQRGCL